MPQSDQLDQLTAELALVREAGDSALDVEALLNGDTNQLSTFCALPVVAARTLVNTTLGTAQATVELVREAAERLGDDPEEVQAQLLFRVHYRTKKLDPAEARRKAQEESGVEMRQFRGRREERLRRLVAQQILELQRESDLRADVQRMMVGAEVPQSVALYWLSLFRDHYFRMETAGYALQTDLTTALVQRRDGLPSWEKYLDLVLWWTVEFSYERDRFFRLHGPLWFAPTDPGCETLCDAAERIEYHDAFPEEYISRLRLIRSRLEAPEPHLFEEAVRTAGEWDFATSKLQQWVTLCTCDLDHPADRCEIHLVMRNTDTFGQTVETEFELIQNWYRTERYAADPGIRDLVMGFRTPGGERPYVAEQK
ncbi:hypothetical protein [Pseudofrankia sp. DC12]|uniref:hypothetical protein n=1 Tax=Pseudofrankia sp. DC12 TaxID=683315 RepID=UPI0012FAA8B2|nr:hypothetical protein [Pseudofrankia sp. DC12]